ncbi:MAG TPA: glycoside hydrolase family 3 protein [Treponemataceae bacterium]|nr:glycoside hydrolase family 3 protein [Treponemataceae bacterium]
MRRTSRFNNQLGALIVVACLVSFAHAKETPITFWTDMPNEQLAHTIVEHMTNEELLAQMLMFGWAGNQVGPLLTSWVKDRELGSVKVFGWDTVDVIDVAKAITFLQAASQENRFKIPLFVATDQEGGIIRHVKGNTSLTPGNLAIGASAYPYDAYWSGYYINAELAALGINMNFAPTIDLYTNPDSTVITTRSFGWNPEYAGILGVSWAKGCTDAGVIATAKHFPGHGDTNLDSHGKLPLINIDRHTLENRELIPFKYLIKAGIPAIMPGHLGFPQLDEKGCPASLSKIMLTDLLRGDLGYNGLIITDDMMMNGATLYAGALSRAVKMAIEAGNNIVLSSTTPILDAALWKNNIESMDADPVFKKTVKDGAFQVIVSKLDYFKGNNSVPLFPDIESISQKVPAPGSKDFFLAQACRSITTYKKYQMYDPEIAKKDSILMVSQFQDFFDKGAERYENSDYFYFSYKMHSGEIKRTGEKLAEKAKKYDTIIICVANDEAAKVADYLKFSNKRVIIISVSAPTLVFDKTWAETVLITYSYSSFSFVAAFAAIAGDYIPMGYLQMQEEKYVDSNTVF